MNKEKISSVSNELKELYDRQKEVHDRLDDCSGKIRKHINMIDSKKAGNKLLIIAAIAVVAEIILLFTGYSFSFLDVIIIGAFLIPGLWKKIEGMKDAKELSKELEGVDLEAVMQEEKQLNEEKDALENNISQLQAQWGELVAYRGKDWRLLEIDPTDAATRKALEQDLRDVVDAIWYSTDNKFLADNWLINNIMLYMTAGLKKDNRTLDRYDACCRLVREGTPWALQLLGTLIIGGSVELMCYTYDEPLAQDLDTSRKNAKVPDPADEDVEFYERAKYAVKKVVKTVGNVLKQNRA